MNWLIRKAGAEIRRQVAAGVQPPLDTLAATQQAQIASIGGQLGGEVAAALPAALRGELGELVRMLRQQGDASDQVAETLGRTLARLGAEVEALGRAVERLEARLGAEPHEPAGSSPGDRPE